MDLNMLISLDYLFYFVFGLAVLAGLIRGMKKTLYSFVTMLIFYAVFFFTINQVVDLLWTMQMPYLAGPLSQVSSDFANFTSFDQSIGSVAGLILGDTFDITTASPEVLALLVGVGQFALKLVYTLIYFTVILLVYKIITLIIYALFFGKKNKLASKNRGFGALFGALNGAMAVFVMLITLGGFMNITENMVALIDASGSVVTDPINFVPREDLYQAEYTIIPLAETSVPDVSESIELLNSLVEHYHTNFFVMIAEQITVTDIDGVSEIPLHLSLFDSVLSFQIEDENIALRYELAVYSQAALIFLESDYADSGVLSDVTGDEIRQMFEVLSTSVLLSTLLPIAIEVGAQIEEIELPITTTELYDIDFDSELNALGSVAGTLFDILNGAGFVSGEGSLEEIEIDGNLVRDVFSDLSDSSIVVLVASTLLVPMIENSEGDLSLIITVPTDLDWETEIEALGNVFAEVVDSGASISDITDGNPSALLTAVSNVDLTVLMSSELITTALINVLSNPEILSLDFLVIPDNIIWRDTYDSFGNLTEAGELRNILVALNAIAESMAGFDISTIGIDFVSELTESMIDDIFESRILVATVSDLLLAGDLPLDVPSIVLDEDGYLVKQELKDLSTAIKLITTSIDSLTEIDMTKLFTLTETDINILLESKIISTTVGKLVYELAGDPLVVPSTTIEDVEISTGDTVMIISSAEIVKILLSLQSLGITDLNNITFDASIISHLELIPVIGEPTTLDDALIDQLLDSEIVHATISKMVFDLSVGATSVLVVPVEDEDNINIRYTSAGIDYLSKVEIANVLKALYAINITDFSLINLENTSLILEHKTELLESAIIHATISDMILGIASTSVSIPETDSIGVSIKVEYADVTYITKAELNAFFDALNLLGITDPTAFSSSLNLDILTLDASQDIFLASAIMHSTVSKTVLDLDSSILIVPLLAEDETTEIQVTTGPVGFETTYIAKNEVKAILNALIAMGFTDLDSFGSSISSTLFFDYREEMLLSSSLQATISNQLLTVSSGTLIIPDSDSLGNPIRIVESDVTYVTKVEINKIIDALELLGLTDLSSFDLSPSSIFAVDFNDLLESDTMQATVSYYVLENALDESAVVGSATLIVPSALRELFDINGVLNAGEKIEKAELIALLNSLEVLNISNFSGSIDASIITDLDGSQMDTVLASGSMHITIDHMLKGNANVSSAVPDLALETVLTIPGVITSAELKAFILSTNILAPSGSFTTVNIDITSVTSLSESDRDIVLDSMIIRNILTDQLETMMTADDPIEMYWPNNNDYMNADPLTFLTESGINLVLTHYSLI